MNIADTIKKLVQSRGVPLIATLPTKATAEDVKKAEDKLHTDGYAGTLRLDRYGGRPVVVVRILSAPEKPANSPSAAKT